MTGWPRVRLDAVTTEVRRVVLPSDLGVRAVFHYSIPTWDETGDGATEDPAHIGSGKLLLAGDEVLVSKLNPRKTRVLETSPHEQPTVASTEFVALRPAAGIDRRFLGYLLRSEVTRQTLAGAVQSVTRSQQRVNPYDVTKMWLRLPPCWEQRAIADFLDTETSRIDALIEKRRGMLALLSEAVLSRVRFTLTDGIDYEAPLSVTPTDVVRTDRSPVRLSWRFRLGSGTTPMSGDPRYYGAGEPWVVTGDLRDSELTTVTRSVTPGALADHSALTVHPAGSLVIAMYGATIGRMGLLTFPATVNQACCVISPRDEDRPEFVFFWLLAFRRELIEMGRGAGQPNISQQLVGAIRIAMPDPTIQGALIAECRRMRKEASRVADLLSRQVDVLLERRRALITAAVTGEIDVTRKAS